MLAKEGRLPVLALALAGLLGAYLVHPGAALPLWAAAGGAWMLFRSREPTPTDLPLAVVSPVSGTVHVVGQAYDPWSKRPALRISFQVPFPGISVLYSPADGRIDGFWTDLSGTAQCESGSLDAWLESPTRYTLGIMTDGGDAIVYSVGSSGRHSRLKFDQAPGERARRSARGGFVYFGATVDVLVPQDSRSEVSEGERVNAGQIVATLVHG